MAVACLWPFLCFTVASAVIHHTAQTTSSTRAKWKVEDVPNPMKNPEQCGLNASGYICDPDGMLTNDQRQGIEQALVNISQQTRVACPDGNRSYQAAVLVVESVASSEWLGWWDKERTGEAFAHKVGDAWGVGNSGCDNGVMLFLSINDRMFYLKTAKRTREVLTDGMADVILRNMRPMLKSGKTGGAIMEGVTEISLALQGHTIPVHHSIGEYFAWSILALVFCCHLPQFIAFFMLVLATLLAVVLYPFAKLADAVTACWRSRSKAQAEEDLQRVQKELERDEFNQSMCPICLEDFEDDAKSGKSIDKLECKHCFHEACIKPWLQAHSSCPLCRCDVDAHLSAEDRKKPEDYRRRLRFYLSRLSARYPSTFVQSGPTYYQNDGMYFVYVPSSYADSVSGHFSSVASASTSLGGVGPGGSSGGFGGGGFGGGGGAGGGW